MATETVTRHYQEIMLDIESLSLQPDALVLSIGAQTFTCESCVGPAIGGDLLLVPSMTQQIIAGRHVDQGTQQWWAEQPAEARLHWQAPLKENSVGEALVRLADFCKGADHIWANGICFDITVLEHLFRQNGVKVPWKYNAVRDARTVYDTGCIGSVEKREYVGPLSKDLVPHHPVHDCTQQIIRLWEAGYSR